MLAAADLIESWEQGKPMSLPRRGASLLRLLGVGSSAQAHLSVGQRDALLMGLRRHVLGSQVDGVMDCPACQEQVELSFDLDDVLVEPPGDPGENLDLIIDGCVLRARPPKASDLLIIEGADPRTDLRMALIEKCVLESRQGDLVLPVRELPEAVLSRLAETLAEADPQADVHFEVQCPACGHSWTAVFDILAFFWSELEVWGRRMLFEVHTLALAYGWREVDILGMSGWRRAQYLELVRR
jgi:hypothetical protein